MVCLKADVLDILASLNANTEMRIEIKNNFDILDWKWNFDWCLFPTLAQILYKLLNCRQQVQSHSTHGHTNKRKETKRSQCYKAFLIKSKFPLNEPTIIGNFKSYKNNLREFLPWKISLFIIFVQVQASEQTFFKFLIL